MNKEISHNWKLRTAFFLTGEGLSMLGSSMVQYAIMWYLVLDTASGSIMTLYVLVGFLPHAILSPLGGVLADRLPRKKIIIFSDGAIAVVTLLLIIVFSQGYRSVWILLAASFLRAIGGSIQAPAVNAILPQLIPKEKLMSIGGLNSSIQSMIYIISPALGGLLLSIFDIVSVLYVDIITAATAILILLFLSIPPHEKAKTQKKGGTFKDLTQGLSYIKEHPYIGKILLFYSIFCIFIAPASFLSPIYISRMFGSAVWMLTVQEISYSGGAIIGGLLLSYWGGFQNRAVTVSFGTILFGAFLIFLGIAPFLALFYIFSFLIGITLPLSSTTITVLLQERVENDILGRVFSIVSVVGAAGVPLGMVVFGPLADMIDIRYIFYLCGAAIIVLGFSFLKQKKNFAPEKNESEV